MKLCKNQKFELGKILSTPAALEMLNEKMISPLSFLQRHQSGEDWGQICEEDKQQNNLAIANEGTDKQERVFSSYKVGKSTLYIITEWNREITTLLLSTDY